MSVFQHVLSVIADIWPNREECFTTPSGVAIDDVFELTVNFILDERQGKSEVPNDIDQCALTLRFDGTHWKIMGGNVSSSWEGFQPTDVPADNVSGVMQMQRNGAATHATTEAMLEPYRCPVKAWIQRGGRPVLLSDLLTESFVLNVLDKLTNP